MKIYFLSFIFLISTACTKVELGYRLAPRSAVSRLDDAFNFKSDRLKEVRSQIENDFKKNKIAVANLIILHVDEISELSNKKEISATDFKLVYESMQKSRAQLMQLFKPSFEAVLTHLTPEEVSNLEEYSGEKIKEQDKKSKNRDDFIEKQMDTFEKVMDFFFDDTTQEQKIIYETFVNQHYDFFKNQIEARKGFIVRFKELSERKSTLLDYVIRYYSGDPNARSEVQQKNLAPFLNDLYLTEAKIWQIRTDKQKKNLTETLKNLKKELLSLAAS